MIKCKNFLIAISIIIVIIFTIQVGVYASDNTSSLGFLSIVIGVALVCTGVGIAVAAGSIAAPAWSAAVPVIGISAGEAASYGGALLIGGDAIMRRDEIRRNQERGGASDPVGENDPAYTPVKDHKIEIVKLSENATEAVIQVKLLDTRLNKYVDIPDYDLYISHTNDLIALYEGDCSTASVSSNGINTSGTVGILSVPNVTVAGITNKIEYSLDKEVQFVNMKVLNSSDQVVYDISESCPDPANPLPFVWKGTDMLGKNLSAGAYTVKVKAVKKDGTSEDAPLQIVTLSDSIPAGTWEKITLEDGKRSYTLQSDYNEGTDKVTVKMRDKNGNDVSAVDSATMDVDFKEDGGTPSIVQNPLNFSTVMEANVDGVLVKIEMPGADDASKEIKVTVDPAGSNQAIYRYDTTNADVYMDGTKYTSTSNKDVYFAVLNQMSDIAEKSFAQAGLQYDAINKTLSINNSTFAAESGIGSEYVVSVTNDTGSVSIKAVKGGESITTTYDLSTGQVTTPADFTWADSFEWDMASNQPIEEIGPITTASIRAAGVSDALQSVMRKAGAYGHNLVWYGRTIMKSAADYPGVKKSPMERPTEPDITDINWMDRPNKKVTIKGTAGKSDTLSFYVANAGSINSAGTATADIVGLWKKDISLQDGENKINAIVRTTDGREVETGDATVYVGTSGEPDLILVCPRDRQVFWDSNISSSSPVLISVKYKGIATANSSVKVSISNVEQSLNVPSSGAFEENLNIGLKEGANSSQLTVNSSAITTNIELIGAYKFINDIKSNAYVLRRGDFMFSSKGDGGFDIIPAEPDHVGVYLGDKKVVDPVLMGGTEKHDLSIRDKDNYYYGDGFYYATQIPKIVDEDQRVLVIEKISPYVSKKDYDMPYNLLTWHGHYDGADNGKFYCSELAYWGWNQVLGNATGINLLDTMYPARGFPDTNNSILPAYFLEETMKVKEVVK